MKTHRLASPLHALSCTRTLAAKSQIEIIVNLSEGVWGWVFARGSSVGGAPVLPSKTGAWTGQPRSSAIRSWFIRKVVIHSHSAAAAVATVAGLCQRTGDIVEPALDLVDRSSPDGAVLDRGDTAAHRRSRTRQTRGSYIQAFKRSRDVVVIGQAVQVALVE